MSNSICPKCGAALSSGEACSTCSALTAIALPEVAAQVKTAPAAGSDAAFSEGLPPMPRLAAARSWLPTLVICGMVLATAIGLLIPAVLKVREAQARTSSICHLKQIALAGHSFHDANKRLPFNGSARPSVVNGVETPYSAAANAGQFTSGSWGFQIAQFMDQAALFQNEIAVQEVKAFLCPGRGRPGSVDAKFRKASSSPWSDYVINPWLNDDKAGTADAPDIRRTLIGITDGTSNTIFFGHGQIRPADYSATESVPGYIDTILLGGTTATALSSNPALGPVTFALDSNDTRTDSARGFGSPFSQGCLMAMCDATVRMFPYEIPVGRFPQPGEGFGRGTLATFLTPCGNDVGGLPDT